ncbi:MAG TPA: acyl-CoA dehydrogenase family protein, partial [Gemmatimonadales bacterium]|nr:acyl-CoA dehydrogenase family protein [Gemmatimonadales bacterium]
MTDVLTPKPTEAEPARRPAPATAQEAREVAEAAREQEWRASFVKELFDGRLRLELIHPFPEPTSEDVAKAQPFLDRLETFLREKVDGDKIDREGQIPPEVVQELKEMGAFGIKISEEYGGLGLSQLMYARAI